MLSLHVSKEQYAAHCIKTHNTVHVNWSRITTRTGRVENEILNLNDQSVYNVWGAKVTSLVDCSRRIILSVILHRTSNT